MNNYTMDLYEMKREIVNFSKNIFVKFIYIFFVYGILEKKTLEDKNSASATSNEH